MDEQNYWHGTKNKAVRYWFYVTRGNDVCNQFHTAIYSTLGIYWVLKLHDFWWLILIGVVIIPVQFILGYIQVHHIGKVVEWLSIKYSTHYSQLGYKYQEKMIEKLEEIATELKRE